MTGMHKNTCLRCRRKRMVGEHPVCQAAFDRLMCRCTLPWMRRAGRKGKPRSMWWGPRAGKPSAASCSKSCCSSPAVSWQARHRLLPSVIIFQRFSNQNLKCSSRAVSWQARHCLEPFVLIFQPFHSQLLNCSSILVKPA